MDRNTLEQLLTAVRDGQMNVDGALQHLRDWPMVELEDATLDTHRHLRRGFPEVILAEHKTDDQISDIVGRLLETESNLLITRLDADRGQKLLDQFPDRGGELHGRSRLVLFRREKVPSRGMGVVAVITAGTSDRPVAEEAALTCELMGNDVVRVSDVGVSGIHRLFAHRELLARARVIVVVAGMEGALASVIGGLVDKPVIAVPTSVGYGASFGGVAALLSMLNACAPGITVVNIDNGFGAGYAAALMNRREDA